MTDTRTRPFPETHARDLIRWSLIGTGVALFLMLTQAMALGGWTALLAVGEDAAIRPVIEAEIPGVVLLPDAGNDGQIYYAIALEPFDDEYADLLPESSLRWRRIMLPAVASGFGLVDGVALFWSMTLIVAVSLGIGTAALADIGRSLGLRSWIALALLVHPGVWIGVRLLSPDLPAIALALLAVALALRHRHVGAVVALAAAVLTKEPYLVVACSLGAWSWFKRERLTGISYVLVPAGALIGWSAVVRAMIPGTVFESGNVAWPFMGIVEASRWWPDIATSQNVRTAIALVMVAVAIVIGARYRGHALLHWLLWPWVGLALVTSHWVWRFGNGSLRAFAVIGVFAAMMVADRRPPEPDRGSEPESVASFPS